MRSEVLDRGPVASKMCIRDSYYMDAYVSMLSRDVRRVENASDILNESPLGCAALAGTTHGIDRNMTAKEMGFRRPVSNFLDGVSDRDYLIELTSAMSMIMMHLSLSLIHICSGDGDKAACKSVGKRREKGRE